MSDCRLEYVDWLIGFVGYSPVRGKSYDKLLNKLYDTIFRWSLSGDENRVLDALDLRHDSHFAMNMNRKEANVLEVLVSMARRCEDDIMYDVAYGDRTGEWFWRMIDNLGLLNYDDYDYDEDEVTNILDIFMDRKYASNGRGSIFYANHANSDMRDVELWYQMCWYLREHFDFDIN